MSSSSAGLGDTIKFVEDLQPSQIDIADVIRSPFRLLGEHHQLLIPVGISAGIAFVFMVMDFDPDWFNESSIFGGFGFGDLMAIFIFFFMSGWLVSMMKEIKESGNTGIESSLSILMNNLVAFILGIVLSSLIITGGLLALIVPGIILCVALCCTVPAIILHGFNAIDGLRASWKFCWEGKNFVPLLIVFIVIVLVAFIPLIGGVIIAAISPLLISYAYVENIGKKEERAAEVTLSEEPIEALEKIERPVTASSGKDIYSKMMGLNDLEVEKKVGRRGEEQIVSEDNNVRCFIGDSKQKFYVGRLVLTNQRLMYLSSGKKSSVLKDSVVGGQLTVEYFRSRKTKDLDISALKIEGSIESKLEDIVVCEEERWALAKLLHIKLRNGSEYRFSILGKGDKPKEFEIAFLKLKKGA